VERVQHSRAKRHGGTMTNIWQKLAKIDKRHRRATWHGYASLVFVAWLAIGVSIRWDFRATLFCGFILSSLALFFAKCCSSFHFFDTAPENI